MVCLRQSVRVGGERDAHRWAGAVSPAVGGLGPALGDSGIVCSVSLIFAASVRTCVAGVRVLGLWKFRKWSLKETEGVSTR